MKTDRTTVPEYLAAAGVVAVATAVCLALRARFAPIDVAMVLLAGVVLVGARYRKGPSLFAALLSILTFDFLFVPPYYRLNANDSGYYLTFGVMLVVALTMGRLTTRVREQREAAAERERHTAALYALDRDLAAAPDTDSLLTAALGHLNKETSGETTVLLADTLGSVGDPCWPHDPPFDQPDVRIAGTWALEHTEPAGWSTENCADAAALLLPLRGTSQTVGLVVIRPADPGTPLSPERLGTVRNLVDIIADAVERRQLAERNERVRVEIEAERLRTALLSSLSHDLRTPLASIEGSASALLDDPGQFGIEDRHDLLEGILAESRRMSRLVTNLLNMIRVESGELSVQRSWQPLEEPLGVALLRMDEPLREHPVTTDLPSDLPLVPVDELLLEQVFVNLLENAARHTPAGTPITVRAWQEPGEVVVEVGDQGPGIPPGEEEAVFGRFYRADPAADPGTGAGLGLTICRGIVTAHGGRIWIEPSHGQGTRVRLSLPVRGVAAGLDPVEVAGEAQDHA